MIKINSTIVAVAFILFIIGVTVYTTTSDYSIAENKCKEKGFEGATFAKDSLYDFRCYKFVTYEDGTTNIEYSKGYIDLKK